MNVLKKLAPQAVHLKKIILLAFFLASALMWLGFWLYSQYYISTDNAYINANIVQVTPRMTGHVVNLHVVNNQYVTKGTTLFNLDEEPVLAEYDAAKAQLAVAEAQLTKTDVTAKRTNALVKKQYLSPQDGDNTLAALRTAAGELEVAKARLKQARINLQYTHVVAPVSGWVTNLSLQNGNIVTANQPLFAIISNQQFWADANFKETELGNIKPGQLATVVTDIYPKHPFKAVVDSISSGTGSAFSLLPPQNATGNWVKVTQRIPVRIRILDPDPRFQLRVGATATVTISLNDKAAAKP